MIDLDVLTVSVMTALVASVASVTFILDTFIRRDSGPGRIWAAAFFCGLTTTFAYLAWAAGMGTGGSVAVGNALFVCVPGFVWLGCRRFNDRPLWVASVVVAVLAVSTFILSIVQESTLGSWAGWTMMAASLVVLFATGAVQSLRPPMLHIRTAWALSAVLAVASVYYLVRLVIFVAMGPDSELFSVWFGTISANFVTVVLTMIAAIVTSVLRSHRTTLQRYEWLTSNGVAADGVMLERTFEGAAAEVVERASWRDEGVAVLVLRIEGLAEIRAAFGVDAADEVLGACRLAVRRYAPASALVGEDEDDQLAVCALAATAVDARRLGATIYRGCVEELSAARSGLFPFVGVGVAVAEDIGYDLVALRAAARVLARRAAAASEASVMVSSTAAHDS